MPGRTSLRWNPGFAKARVASSSGPLFITGAAADGTHFVDQNGNPRLLVNDNIWAILPNSGRWSSGDWQGTLNTYLTDRAAQGYTAVKASFSSWPGVGTDWVSGRENGPDWDGTYPFTSTTDPSSGFNETFWARRDYFISAARTRGLVTILNITTSWLEGSPTVFSAGWTTTQWQNYGTALGNRYKNIPGILWELGDDIFGTYNTELVAFIAALRATGDTHSLTTFNYQETSSRLDLFTDTKDPIGFDEHSQYEWIYTYNVTYVGVEKAQLYTPTASDDVQGVIPPIWGDGHYLASGVGGGQTDTRLMRQMIWWALSSGAAGFSFGDNEVYGWSSGAAALVTSKSFYSGVVPAISSAFSGLSEWWKLHPDTANTLCTSGRGTKQGPITSGGGGTYYVLNTDNYVTASRTPDTGSGSSLAVLYCGLAMNVTIDQSKMKAGYTATWLDPASGAMQAGTPGSTYNSSVAVGNNSVGDPDWVLVLRG